MAVGEKLERAIETVLVASRWLLAPFFLALGLSLLILLLKAGQHLMHVVQGAVDATETAVVVDVLGLIDISLTGLLVVLVIFSGYENFISRIRPANDASWPAWIATIDFSGLKLKLMSTIVAISGIETLRDAMDVENKTDREMAWSVGILLAFVVATVLLALSDRIAGHHAAGAAAEAEH